MSRPASRISSLLIVMIALVVMAPGAWADPPSDEERGRSQHGSDRSQGADRDRKDRSSGGRAAEDGSEAASEDEDPPEEPSGPPSSDPRGSGSEQPSGPEMRTASDTLEATFTASPAHIAPGEISTLTVIATNRGEETIHSLDLMAELPRSLELVSTDPSSGSGRGVLQMALGSLPPGASAQAELVVAGVATVGPGSPIRFALIADDHVSRHEVMVQVDAGSRDGLGLSPSGPLLVQVGDSERFSLTVSNTTDAALADVAVVAEIASELDVVGVVPVTEADAIQLGSSASREDIVWIFDELRAGESVELAWTAKAVAPGDLEATNTISAAIGGRDAARTQQSTYLGFVEAVEIKGNGAPAPVVRKRVVTTMVPVTKAVGASVGGLLPVTGASPIELSWVAVLLFALGTLCLWLSARPSPVRRGGVVALSALLLTAVACVSSPESPSGSSSRMSGGTAAERAAGVEQMPEPPDEVLGVRIERDERAPEREETSVPSTAATAAEEELLPTETVLEEVVTVRSVFVAPETLPVRSMATRSGDNTMTVMWTPPTDLTAASSRMLAAEQTEELLVAIEASGSRLDATVALTNLAQAERLQVRGRLTLSVTGSGSSSILHSAPVDVVLEPGASVDADFAFALPSGTFTVTGGFLSD